MLDISFDEDNAASSHEVLLAVEFYQSLTRDDMVNFRLFMSMQAQKAPARFAACNANRKGIGLCRGSREYSFPRAVTSATVLEAFWGHCRNHRIALHHCLSCRADEGTIVHA